MNNFIKYAGKQKTIAKAALLQFVNAHEPKKRVHLNGVRFYSGRIHWGEYSLPMIIAF